MGMLKPPEFTELLASMTIVVGVGEPIDSPTALVGLAVGAAFLNSYDGYDAQGRRDHVQHLPLEEVEEPYVYMYQTKNTTALLEAAEKAAANPFGSFVPRG